MEYDLRYQEVKRSKSRNAIDSTPVVHGCRKRDYGIWLPGPPRCTSGSPSALGLKALFHPGHPSAMPPPPPPWSPSRPPHRATSKRVNPPPDAAEATAEEQHTLTPLHTLSRRARHFGSPPSGTSPRNKPRRSPSLRPQSAVRAQAEALPKSVPRGEQHTTHTSFCKSLIRTHPHTQHHH